jgi:carboxyl-terminal processing protease
LRDARNEEAKAYKDLFDKDIESLQVSNLDVDIDYINLDESRVARNDDWIESIKKDIYIEEVIHILKDMVHSHKDLAHKN